MNIKKAKYILKQNGYIINETKKVKRIENRKLLHEAGFTDILVPILVESKLSDKQAEEINKFKKELNKNIATSIKLKNQKQTKDIKAKETEQVKKSFNLMNLFRSKMGKKAFTALRALTVAASLFGAPLAGMEEGVIEFETDHGAYELSNDGVTLLSDNGEKIFTYSPDTGKTQMMDGITDKQLDILNNDFDKIEQNLATTYELELDDVNIHSSVQHAAANNKTADNDDDLFDMEEIEHLNKLHDIKTKLGLDGMNDVRFAQIVDPDYNPSDAQIDDMTPEEREAYIMSHEDKVGEANIFDGTDDDEVNKNMIKNGQKYIKGMIANGHIDLSELLSNEQEMVDYMKAHNHDINGAESIPDQYMRCFLNVNGVSEKETNNLDGSKLETAYFDMRHELETQGFNNSFDASSEESNDNDDVVKTAAKYLDDDDSENA